MRWPAKPIRNSWDWHRWFAWYPVRVDFDDGTAEWVWLETVEIRIRVNEGGGASVEGRRDPWPYWNEKFDESAAQQSKVR